MSLFSKKAVVNLADVAKFRENVSDFAYNSVNLESELVNTLQNMEGIASERAQKLEEIAKSYEELYLSVKRMERDTEHSISSLRSELARTPKETEREVQDSNGNTKIKKTPNPQYKELESQIAKVGSKLSGIKDLAYRVNNELSYSRRIAGELRSSANELKGIIPNIQSDISTIRVKTEAAIDSLERCMRAIQNYISFTFRSR